MFRHSLSSLRVRLTLLIFIAVIPALGLIISTALEQRRTAAEEAKLDALRLTQLAAGNFNNYFEGGRQLLMALSKISRVQRLDSAACNVYFTAILKENPLYLNIIGVDTAGYAFASGVPLKSPISYADRPWIHQAMKTRNFAVGDFALARTTGKPSTFFAYPIIDEQGILRGALAASVNLDWLNQLAQEANLPTGATLTLVDRSGTILARYPHPEKWVGKIMPEATHIKTIIQNKEGVGEIAGMDGVQRLYAFTPVHGMMNTGLYISIGISKGIAFKKINRVLYRNLAILGIVAVLALTAAWWGGNILLLRPVRRLLEATKKIKNGDLSARTGLTPETGELGQLARDFDEMAVTIERRSLETEKVQEALRESEEKFRSFVETTDEWIWAIDVEGRHTYSNPAVKTILGYNPEEIVGKDSLAFMHEEDRQQVAAMLPKLMADKCGWSDLVIRWRHQDGSYQYLESTSIPILGPRGELIGYRGTDRDITERKRAEEALKLSEEKHRTLIDNIQDGVFIIQDGKMQFVNEAFAKIGGYTVEEVTGMDFRELVVPEDLEMVAERYRRRQAGEEVPREYEFRVLHKDKTTRLTVNMNVGLVTYQGRVASMGTVKDITEKKRAEKALRETTEKLRAVVQASPLAIIATDMEGKITMWNPAAEHMFGWTEQEILRSLTVPIVPEDQRQKRWEMRQRLLRGEIFVEDEAIRQRKDGSRIQVNIARAPLRDEQGKIVGSMAVITDITERKHLEAQLLQAQKMEAVGTLAGGIAHDFNNLLTAITVNVELAKAKVSKSKPVEPHLKEIEKVALRAAQLTSQLLSFSRRQLLQPVPLNLNDIITNLSNMLVRIMGEHIELELRLAGDLWVVKADPGHIEQVIMNLCVNARDAMPTGGRLTLKTQNLVIDESYDREHPEFKIGDYVVLEVADTGTGMNKATMERIFEPFFTTKEVGKGTGLGLSMVFGIVKQHEGHVNVYSEPDMGTTFKIYLPRIEEPVMVKETPQIIKKIIGGRETVLVAEDEDPLRQAIGEMLESFGYTVLLARDGREAVEIYRLEGERIDLVLLDVVMPRLGGKDTADFIQKFNPRQKILFSSGYSAEGIHESFMIPAGMQFIQKPYTAEDLAQKVRELLGSQEK